VVAGEDRARGIGAIEDAITSLHIDLIELHQTNLLLAVPINRIGFVCVLEG
jgi:hypothetical protein